MCKTAWEMSGKKSGNSKVEGEWHPCLCSGTESPLLNWFDCLNTYIELFITRNKIDSVITSFISACA